MCGRYEFSADKSSEMVRRAYEWFRMHNVDVKTGKVVPGDVAMVIACNREGHPQVFGMQWGYRLDNGKMVINARSETAARKAMFADGMHQRRCLIPADFYYEWEKTSAGKTRYRIEAAENRGCYLAGIYRFGKERAEFVVLTREAAQDISFIHDRMPVIFPEELALEWLNPRIDGNIVLQYALQDVEYCCDEEEQCRLEDYWFQ